MNTFLYESAIDSIRQLEAIPAQHRVLMIFSDGEAEFKIEWPADT